MALLVGFVLLAPSLNHSVLAFGEITFGILAGTAEADVVDLLRNTGLAAAGNIVGGVGFVAFTRMVQAREAMDAPAAGGETVAPRPRAR